MKFKIILAVVICLGGFTNRATALREFKKSFEKHYAELLADEEIKATFRKAKCNLCHVKGEKKEINNPYGEALSKLIEGDAEDRLKAAKENGTKKEELEKILAELDAAMTEVEPLDSPDGMTFGERIKSGQVPVEIPAGEDDDEDEDEEEEDADQEATS